MTVYDHNQKPRFNILHPIKSLKANFDWRKSQTDINSEVKTKRGTRRPVKKDWTEDYTINLELTKGLYHNQYPGFKLSGGLAYPVIAVPVSFMGFPVIKTNDDNDKTTNEKLATIVERFIMDMKKIHIQSHRDGTCWIYPKYDRESGEVVLEFIPDDTITDIVKDMNTGKVIALYTDERITIKTGYNSTASARRIRIFTAQKVEVMYKEVQGSTNGVIRDKSMRNPIGILPIPFANNSDGQEIRGYSDYERILSNLKNYHDVKLSEAEILAKFKTKMILKGLDNVADWLDQNALDDIDDLDIRDHEIFFNVKNEELDFKVPERTTEGHHLSLKNDFRLIVQGSGIPEIVFGVKTEGNANTAEEQMASLIHFVKDKKRAKVRPYEMLFMAIMRLYQIVEPANRYQADNLVVEWEDLDAVSDKVKSEIFKNFAQGLASIMSVAALTKQQLFELWKQNFPNATKENYDEFIIEIEAMSAFKRITSASLQEGMEMQGFDENGNRTSDPKAISNNRNLWDKLINKNDKNRV